MQDPNNDGSAQEKLSQEKFAALARLIEETQHTDTSNRDKLQQKRDELYEMVKDVEKNTTAASRDEYQLRTRKAKGLIRDIDENHLNPISKTPGMGLDSIISDLQTIYESAGMLAISQIYPIGPIVGLAIASLFYVDLLARLADHIDKSLLYRMHSSRGGGLGPAEMRKMFLESMDRKIFIAASQAALKNMPATARDKLLNNREFRQHVEQTLHWLLPASPEQREQWLNTKEQYEALQEYEEKGPDTLELITAGVEAAQRDLGEPLPKPGEVPLNYLPPVMQKTKDENEALYNAAFKANKAAKESPGYAQAAIRDRLLSDRSRREKMPPDYADGDAFARKYLLDFKEQDWERASGAAEKSAALSARNNDLPGDTRSSPQLEYRFSGPFTAPSPAVAAGMSAASAAAAAARPTAGAVTHNVNVNINGILPPPTRLADEDFHRCMQREINHLVMNVESGVNG